MQFLLIKIYQTNRIKFLISHFRDSRENLECFRLGSRVEIVEPEDRDFRTLVPTTTFEHKKKHSRIRKKNIQWGIDFSRFRFTIEKMFFI